MQKAEIIDRYDVMFAARTGVTILIPKSPTFDGGGDKAASFRVSPENPKDILISAAGKSALLKGLRPDYMEEAVSRGMIMFYELADEEVVRCTPCSYRK